MADTESNTPENADLSPEHLDPEQIRIRKEKRQRLLDSDTDAYPVGIPRTHTLAEVHAAHDGLEVGDETEDIVGVVGRVVFVRTTGKLCFVTLQSGDGTRLQGMLSLREVGEERLGDFKTDVDLGDFLFVHGKVIKSKRGELSVLADSWSMASKALRPLPGLHTELAEDTRVRQRYLDLITREDARKNMLARAEVMSSLRRTFAEQEFVEIETPMLQFMHGGAAARPFKTHMNAYDIDMFLRIAPELFLKRAIVGGIENVFEINRNFRNEGADSTHSPEFAMLEAYQSYGDYHSIAELTKTLVQNAAQDATGSLVVKLGDGEDYDFGGDWPVVSMYETLSAESGVEVTPETGLDVLDKIAADNNVELGGVFRSHGKYVEELWEHFYQDKLWMPTFVTDFPVDTSPLVREHRTKKGVVEKWDLYVRGFELATGYSELVDPVIQRERFEAQAADAAKGDEEAMGLDEEFLTAMEHGMPPTGGMGMGLDRLLMALTGLGIRETILFPFTKPIATGNSEMTEEG
ncbi:lysine--tRNA ligase [Brevibacterium sp. BDJS002]|uniref:lysine--tRNA ligase n=1 Tax=Brevibacterium sp. BDJS002 TaxID=3020906 RepID=UPI002306F8AC|nr:lysine--tRNA ligase [Brevibacterium sp. BDJS002]MDN5774553.1 lysine--tRNA ligase [Brevibacterium aurantiacum]WCE41121.1 lysine--tRNA ligase [Brevibacterium sp. BDJS002]